jgi:hypothetical protein
MAIASKNDRRLALHRNNAVALYGHLCVYGQSRPRQEPWRDARKTKSMDDFIREQMRRCAAHPAGGAGD